MDLHMSSSPSFIFCFFLAFLILTRGVLGATFTFVNKCEYTVWPGILANAGSPSLESTGFELPKDSSRAFTAPTGWSGRFWGRTGCNFDESGLGSCAAGDCGSGQVECNGAGAAPPATLAEFTLGTSGQDFYDVSLVDGYNLPVVIEASGGSGVCATTGCVTDVNQICPAELKLSGGQACRSACEAFAKPEYCCSGAYSTPTTCKPSVYSEMFKSACPRSYSYAYDDPTSTFTCSGADYTVTFCPSIPSQKSSKDTVPTTTTSGGGSKSAGTGMVDPESGSGGMVMGSGVGSGGTGATTTGSGSEAMPMLSDGSWMAGLAMGRSTRIFATSDLRCGLIAFASSFILPFLFL